MSADNWSECPKCRAIKRQKFTDVENLYGKVPIEEYTEQVARLRRGDSGNADTLREDYEFYIDKEDMFHVSYKCSCVVCKYSFSYKHSEKLRLGWFVGVYS